MLHGIASFQNTAEQRHGRSRPIWTRQVLFKTKPFVWVVGDSFSYGHRHAPIQLVLNLRSPVSFLIIHIAHDTGPPITVEVGHHHGWPRPRSLRAVWTPGICRLAFPLSCLVKLSKLATFSIRSSTELNRCRVPFLDACGGRSLFSCRDVASVLPKLDAGFAVRFINPDSERFPTHWPRSYVCMIRGWMNSIEKNVFGMNRFVDRAVSFWPGLYAMYIRS